MKDLQKDDTIVIIKPDKGNGIVVLDRPDYISKMLDILGDESKFVPMNDDPIKTTIKREEKVRTFLKKLKNDLVISEELYIRSLLQLVQDLAYYVDYLKYINTVFPYDPSYLPSSLIRLV